MSKVEGWVISLPPGRVGSGRVGETFITTFNVLYKIGFLVSYYL